MLYTSAFRRLQGKTQVVTPGEADFFRTRLTHTLEVAQVAKRLTEGLNRRALELEAVGQLSSWDESLSDWVAPAGMVDPDVCEAAAVLHDLGHPPFGHAGEQALATGIQEVLEAGDSPWTVPDSGSFEGNAQSFRLATHALTHKQRGGGLELTRAVLDASLKYPRLQAEDVSKWSVYPTEAGDFHDFVRAGVPESAQELQTIEAQIMDWADDIAYSVHDLDDWFRAGFMPIVGLVSSRDQLDGLAHRLALRWIGRGKMKEADRNEVDGAVRNLFQYKEGPFAAFIAAVSNGKDVAEPSSAEAHEAIRFARSALFDEFLGAVSLGVRAGATLDWTRRYALELRIEPRSRLRCDILRELLWIYVVGSPRMATHQAGQRAVVTELLQLYLRAAKADSRDGLDIFPLDVRGDLLQTEGDDLLTLRLVVDFVSGMTDAYALRAHARLTGREGRFNEFF